MTGPQNPIQPYYQSDEITLKELILKVREFTRELWRNWKILLLICIPAVAYMLYDAFTTPVIYPATLTFVIDEDESSRLGGVASVLGEFGINSGNRGRYNLDRILEISRSRRVLQMALFSQCEVNGMKDYLANHLINQYDYHKNWKEDTTGLKDFLFSHGQVAEFGRVENRVLKQLLGLLTGNAKEPGVYQTSYGEETGIMSLKMSGPTPDLSITMVDTIFSKLTSYYVYNATNKAESTYELMRKKTDSLAQKLAEAEYRLAEFLDRNKNVYSARDGSLQQSRLTADVQRLQILHGESLKNLEYADFALKNKTPFIALLDSPIPPIWPVRESKLRATVLGLIIGLVIGTTFIIGRKIYRDAMQ